MFVEAVVRRNAERGKPLPRTAIWAMAARFIWNGRRIETASGFAEHLAIASQIIGMPSHVEGCVIECGCYRGGSTVNLSLACALAGRELQVFDSFDGLPPPVARDEEHKLPHDREVHQYEQGMYAAPLEEVRGNVRRFGNVDVCSFHPGWFEDTLRGFASPCVAAFVDVDLCSSVETCIRAIWPQLVEGGALFVHEARHEDIFSLFYDSDFWSGHLGVRAPGLVGAGSGLGLEPSGPSWGSQLGYAIKPGSENFRRRPG